MFPVVPPVKVWCYKIIIKKVSASGPLSLKHIKNRTFLFIKRGTIIELEHEWKNVMAHHRQCRIEKPPCDLRAVNNLCGREINEANTALAGLY